MFWTLLEASTPKVARLGAERSLVQIQSPRSQARAWPADSVAVTGRTSKRLTNLVTTRHLLGLRLTQDASEVEITKLSSRFLTILAATLALGVIVAAPSATAKKRKVIATTKMELTATRTGSNVISFTVRLDTRRACKGHRRVIVYVSNQLPIIGRTKADGTFSGSVTVDSSFGTWFLSGDVTQTRRQTKKLKLLCSVQLNPTSTQVELDPPPPEAP